MLCLLQILPSKRRDFGPFFIFYRAKRNSDYDLNSLLLNILLTTERKIAKFEFDPTLSAVISGVN